MTRAVYPGTFDPITKGHADVAQRASRIFDQVIVAVGTNPAKKPLFRLPERLRLARAELRGLQNVTVGAFDGLLVEYVKSRGVSVVVRGMRSRVDFDYEYQIALTNRAIAPEVETVFILASPQYSFVSAQLLREIATLGGDISAFVSPAVAEILRRKLRPARRARS